MTTYIHCHIGQSPPDHLIDSMKSIDLVDPDARIVLITDQPIEVDGTTTLQVNEISSPETRQVMNMQLFSGDSNPLWRTSIFRIFLVRDAMLFLGIEQCFHFDSDVLLFQPFNLFVNSIPNFDGLSITPCNEDELVFGFSQFKNIEKINILCQILSNVVLSSSKYKEYSVSMPNEMQLLGGIYKRHPNLIQKLVTIPSEDSNFIFDPSSYGQYFGGTHQGHGPGWYGDHHFIGEKIKQGIVSPLMIEGKPYVKYKEKIYPIVNLHIHSKNTKPFLP